MVYIPDGMVALISHDVTIMLHKPKGYVQQDITTGHYLTIIHICKPLKMYSTMHCPQEKCMKAIPGGRGVVYFRGNTP